MLTIPSPVFATQGIIYDLMAEQQDSYETGRSLIVSWRVGARCTEESVRRNWTSP